MRFLIAILLAASSGFPACALDFKSGQTLKLDTVIVNGKGYVLPTVKAALACEPDSLKVKK